MANNCLVTKLRGIVDNDNIQKLGTIRVTFNPVTSPSQMNNVFYVYNPPESNQAINIKVISGDIKIVDSGGQAIPDWNADARAVTEKTLQPNVAINGVVLNKSGVIEISNKYIIKGFQLGSGAVINSEDLYLPNCNSSFHIYKSKVLGNIKTLSSLPSDLGDFMFVGDYTRPSYSGRLVDALRGKQFRFWNTNALQEYFTLEEVLNCMSTNNKQGIYVSECFNITGDISILLTDDKTALRYPTLSQLSISNCINLTRTPEDVAKLRSLGVTVYASDVPSA